MVALLAFIVGTLEVIFGQKNLFDTKGPFGDNVLKNLDICDRKNYSKGNNKNVEI